jgi:hypothetical protein
MVSRVPGLATPQKTFSHIRSPFACFIYVIIDRSINPAISYSALKYPTQSHSTDGNLSELTSILIEERYLQKYNNHLDQKIAYTVSGAADSANCFNNEDCAHFST